MMKNALLLALVLLLGCKKSETNPTNAEYQYFIFGSYAGECGGNCAAIFKLENQQLFADDGLVYFTGSDNIPFQNTSLSAEKIALAVTLSEQIPNSLFDQPDGLIGCPDCHDQGGYFVEVKLSNGEVRRWNIDPDEADFKPFCDAIRATVT